MEISNIISGVSAFIAAIALIVSIFADRRSKKLDVLLKQKEIDKSEREEEEEKKS
jgi:hypothetical protein